MALMAVALSPIPASAAAAPERPAQTSSACHFVLGFQAMHDELGTSVGECRQDQHFATNGDAQQETTGGLLVWRKSDNWTAFTDGFHTWVNGPRGLGQRLNTERFDWEVRGQKGVARQFHILASGANTAPGSSASLGPLATIRQTLNNCGPASIAEVLHYWGVDKSQGELNTILRHGNPWGMSPEGVPAYAQSIGMSTLLANNGDEGLIKSLVANGFPVIVEQFVSMGDHYTHYRPIEAYDEAGQFFVASDPLLGQGHHISYPEFDQIWAPVRRKFMVIYPPDRQQTLEDVLNVAGWGS